MHTIKITPNLLFEISVYKRQIYIRLPNRIESNRNIFFARIGILQHLAGVDVSGSQKWFAINLYICVLAMSLMWRNELHICIRADVNQAATSHCWVRSVCFIVLTQLLASRRQTRATHYVTFIMYTKTDAQLIFFCFRNAYWQKSQSFLIPT